VLLCARMVRIATRGWRYRMGKCRAEGRKLAVSGPIYYRFFVFFFLTVTVRSSYLLRLPFALLDVCHPRTSLCRCSPLLSLVMDTCHTQDSLAIYQSAERLTTWPLAWSLCICSSFLSAQAGHPPDMVGKSAHLHRCQQPLCFIQKYTNGAYSLARGAVSSVGRI
jgi:hypothetical protein